MNYILRTYIQYVCRQRSLNTRVYLHLIIGGEKELVGKFSIPQGGERAG